VVERVGDAQLGGRRRPPHPRCPENGGKLSSGRRQGRHARTDGPRRARHHRPSDAGIPVRLITCHLKSKLLTFPGGRFNTHDEDERARYGAYALDRRTGEAATLRVALTEALGGHGDQTAVILTGDLNDTVQAATTQLLHGPPGSEIGTRGFQQPDQGDATRMWNLAPLLPAGHDYSRINQGRPELIDHILVSKTLITPPDVVTAQAIINAPLPSIDPADPTDDGPGITLAFSIPSATDDGPIGTP
jgi:predicted extracellular nuclease